MHLRTALLALLFLAGCSENGLSSVLDTSGLDTGGRPSDPETPPEDDPPADSDSEEAPIAEPVADAGPDQEVGRGTTVSLDGTASYDPAGLTPLVYAWTIFHKPNGSNSELSDPTVATPGFVADTTGTYVLDLTVQNAAGVWDSTPARVRVEVTAAPPAPTPVANAGPDQNVTTGATVTVDGSASTDPSGLYPLTYQWRLTSAPSGSDATVSGTGSTVVFVADVEGDYAIDLGVQNSAGVWDPTPDHVVIHAVTPPPQPPVSDAGPDQSVYRGDTVSLTGLASTDPAGLYPLTYAWTLISVPSGSTATLSSTTSSTPSFVADKIGAYTFDLRVTNSAGVADPTPDRVRVNAAAPPAQPPVADAGVDQAVQPLVDVTLDGTASYDPQGLTPLTYQWTMVASPSGATSALSSTSASRPRFFADLAGRYEFDLTVRNSAGEWDPTPDRVVVDATPVDGFYVQVTWDSEADLDLHLINGTSGLFTSGDCSYCNMTPSWGGAGTGDDPSLDWDAIYGWGPETTTITSPASGTYDIKVHYYGMDGSSSCWYGCPATTATAKVYLGGVLAATCTKTLYADGEVWNVARLAWPSRILTAQNTVTTTSLTYCQ